MVLSITIPKREQEQQQEQPLDELISQLKYLETPACRATMKESDRVEKRADVTRQFRQCLAIRNFFNCVPKVTRSFEEELDFLYN
jgi:hypothetical protein